jgi:hypothetical protein
MKRYNIDCIKFYGQVTVEHGYVTDTSVPLIQIFIGQPILNLIKWTETNFKYCTLKEIE